MERHIQLSHPTVGDGGRVVENRAFACGACATTFRTRKELDDHRLEEHQRAADVSRFQQLYDRHDGQIVTHRLYFPPNVLTVDEGFKVGLKEAPPLISAALAMHKNIRVNIVLLIELYKTDEEGDVSRLECFPFRAESRILRVFADLHEELVAAFGEIDRNLDEFLHAGSGWRVLAPFYLELQIVQIRVFRGAAASTCGSHAVTYVRRKGLVHDDAISPRDPQHDGLCIYFALAAAVLRADHGQRAFNVLQNFVQEMGFPAGRHVRPKDVALIENDAKWGELGLAINVMFLDEEEKVVPVYVSRVAKPQRTVVLMIFYTMTEEGQPPRLHYAWLKNDKDLIKIRRKNSTHTLHPCWNCLNANWSEEALAKHQSWCLKNGAKVVIMPKKGDVMSFNREKINGEGQRLASRVFKGAFTAFLDIETLQVPSQKPCSYPDYVMENTRRHREECERRRSLNVQQQINERIDEHMRKRLLHPPPARDKAREDMCVALQEKLGDITISSSSSSSSSSSNQSANIEKGDELSFRPDELERSGAICHHKTKKIYDQIPFMASFILVNREWEVVEEKVFVGLDCMTEVLARLIEVADEKLPTLSPGVPLSLSREEQALLRKCEQGSLCHICGKIMVKGDVALDHDHLTGKFVGLAHVACNLQRRELQAVTVFVHNLAGFDGHPLLRAVGMRSSLVRHVTGIPLNMERFKCLTLNGKIKFLDSFAFLSCSLGALVEQLRASNSDFKMLDGMVENPEQKSLLLRKGVYPYGFASSIPKLKSRKTLPPMADFKSDLDGAEISSSDYKHALKVWEAFGINNMLEYTELYIRSDVRLLAQAVLDLRDNLWKEFQLDICSYLSLPMISKVSLSR